jgi:hypothetical protein
MNKIENETNGHFTGTIQVNKKWLPTSQLRWCKITIEVEMTNVGNVETITNVLQQLWINSNTGSEEWRDIPQVEND